MLPSQFPEFSLYPKVGNFVANHLDMQFNDVRSMMKLPLPQADLPAGCNFAVASTLCNLISGISEVLYTPKVMGIGSGEKFKELLIDFYPWDSSEIKKDEQAKTKVIYDLVRNPLAHSLGVRKKMSSSISIAKNALTEDQLVEIETSSERPSWVPLAVRGDHFQYTLSVWGLYWGVFHLTRILAKNETQMQMAEKRMPEGAH